MIDHLSLTVASFSASKAFFVKALAPLGYGVLMEFPDPARPNGPQVPVVGLGADGKPDFWLAEGKVGSPLHLAFAAKSRAAVDAFYKEAIAAGARDNGPPGTRAHYHPNYYGAFVIDPDGNNIEAVCHVPGLIQNELAQNSKVLMQTQKARRRPTFAAVCCPHAPLCPQSSWGSPRSSPSALPLIALNFELASLN